jgi:hypothetical protein
VYWPVDAHEARYPQGIRPEGFWGEAQEGLVCVFVINGKLPPHTPAVGEDSEAEDPVGHAVMLVAEPVEPEGQNVNFDWLDIVAVDTAPRI